MRFKLEFAVSEASSGPLFKGTQYQETTANIEYSWPPSLHKKKHTRVSPLNFIISLYFHFNQTEFGIL